jgi:hypothetical protein
MQELEPSENRKRRHEAILFNHALAKSIFSETPGRFERVDQEVIIQDSASWIPEVNSDVVLKQTNTADSLLRSQVYEVYRPTDRHVMQSHWTAAQNLTHVELVFRWLSWLFMHGMGGNYRVPIKTDFGYVWIVAIPRHLEHNVDECDFGFVVSNSQVVDALITHQQRLAAPTV